MTIAARSLEKRIKKAKAIDGGNPAAVSTLEAAARLRIGRTLMQKLIRDKRVSSFKIGRALRIPVKSLDKLLRELEREGKKL